MLVSLNIYTLVTNFVIINWKYDMHIKNLILFEHKFVTLNLCIIVVRVQKIQWRAWICQRISLYIFFRFSCSFVFFFLFFWISVAFLRTLNKTNSRTFRQKKSVNLRSAQRIRDDIICAASVFDAHSHKLHFAVKHGTPTRKKKCIIIYLRWKKKGNIIRIIDILSDKKMKCWASNSTIYDWQMT